MSGLDLDAIEARANAATPGPWEFMGSSDDYPNTESWEIFTQRVGDSIAELSIFQRKNNDFPASPLSADAEFIAHARTDVPALLARVCELEAQRARLDVACRLLVHSGDLTPVGARQIRKILTKGDTA